MSTPAPAPASAGYRPRRTLTIGVELVRQLRRRRTMVAFVLVGRAAAHRGRGRQVRAVVERSRPRRLGDGDLDLVGLATAGAWNFTLTMLLFASGFLLTIIAALFLGDSVASEASWSSLRYLLAAPVPRRRLLRSKAIVGLLLTAATLVVLVLASFVIGALAFGTAPLTSPIGGTFTVGESTDAARDRRGVHLRDAALAGRHRLPHERPDRRAARRGGRRRRDRHRDQHPQRDRGARIDAAPAARRVRERLGRCAGHRGRLGDHGHRRRLQRGGLRACVAVAVLRFDRKDIVS